MKDKSSIQEGFERNGEIERQRKEREQENALWWRCFFLTINCPTLPYSPQGKAAAAADLADSMVQVGIQRRRTELPNDF